MIGMKVIYNNRHELPHSKYDYVDLDTLYSRADVLVILAPLTEETRGMINDESIGKMKDGVMVVNVGELPMFAYSSFAVLQTAAGGNCCHRVSLA